MEKRIRREDPIETIAAMIVVLLGTLILAGAFLTYQRASSRNTEMLFHSVVSERGGAEGTMRVQLILEQDGEIVRRDGYLDHIHVIESVQSDGILYSYALDQRIPLQDETPEEAENMENTENFTENGEAESEEAEE